MTVIKVSEPNVLHFKMDFFPSNFTFKLKAFSLLPPHLYVQHYNFFASHTYKTYYTTKLAKDCLIGTYINEAIG